MSILSLVGLGYRFATSMAESLSRKKWCSMMRLPLRRLHLTIVGYVTHKSLSTLMDNAFPSKRSLLIVTALLVLFTSCNPIQATSDPVITQKPFVFKITKVVDKLTGEPIRTNYLKVTIETGEEDPIEYEANNVGGYRVEIPVGAKAVMLVEAPGYNKWELILRPKASKYMEGPVELVPVDSPDEMNGL
jgi:hypothetical protein